MRVSMSRARMRPAVGGAGSRRHYRDEQHRHPGHRRVEDYLVQRILSVGRVTGTPFSGSAGRNLRVSRAPRPGRARLSMWISMNPSSSTPRGTRPGGAS